jgi:hypothetical protein
MKVGFFFVKEGVKQNNGSFFSLKLKRRGFMSQSIKKLQQEVAVIKALLHQVLGEYNKEEWLDSADVKQQFHISDSTLYRLRKEKMIPTTRVGKKYMYPKSFFNALLLAKAKEEF